MRSSKTLVRSDNRLFDFYHRFVWIYTLPPCNLSNKRLATVRSIHAFCQFRGSNSHLGFFPIRILRAPFASYRSNPTLFAYTFTSSTRLFIAVQRALPQGVRGCLSPGTFCSKPTDETRCRGFWIFFKPDFPIESSELGCVHANGRTCASNPFCTWVSVHIRRENCSQTRATCVY